MKRRVKVVIPWATARDAAHPVFAAAGQWPGHRSLGCDRLAVTAILCHRERASVIVHRCQRLLSLRSAETPLVVFAVLLRAIGCIETEPDTKMAEVDINGFEYELDYYHFGHRDSEYSGPLVIHGTPELGGEALEHLSFGIDMATVDNDEEGVYDIQLVNLSQRAHPV